MSKKKVVDSQVFVTEYEFTWHGDDDEMPFAVRLMPNEIMAIREVRGWRDHGYDAAYFRRVVRASGARIIVWLVIAWENEDDEGAKEDH